MLGDLETAGIAFEVVAASGNGSPPLWVQLTPRGAIEARDGRRFVFDPEKLVAAFKAGGVDLPVDFDHETEFAMVNGHRPARGWIVELAAKPAGLFGRVQWLPDAIVALKARSYRYISPTFWRDTDGVTARLLKGAALVTSPALGMPAVASANSKDRPMHLPPEIAAALGLPDDTSVDDAVKAIQALPSSAPEMAATLAAMATVVKELKDVKRLAGAKNVAAKVETAIKSGVFPPSLRDWATELCSSNEASFDTFVEKTGTSFAHLFKEKTYDVSRLAAGEDQADSSTEAMIAQQLGIDPAKMKA
jgi:phage I-like protein